MAQTGTGKKKKTKFRHLSLSLVSSSVSPWFIKLRLTPSIHLSLVLPLLRVRYSYNKNIINYGATLQDPILLFKTPVGTRRKFAEYYRQFGHAHSKTLASHILDCGSQNLVLEEQSFVE
jgi:hypothetical protein